MQRSAQPHAMTVVGVDGCPDGWLAVAYDGSTFEAARVHGDILRELQAGGTGLGGGASTDDLADAFALAVTASDLTGPLRTLPPADSPEVERDPEGLPMEMVYSKRRT